VSKEKPLAQLSLLAELALSTLSVRTFTSIEAR
jgi:hypothetical protein